MRTRRLASAWLPVLAMEAAVLFASSRQFSDPVVPFPHVDKVAHLMEYALLGGLLYRACRLSGCRSGGAAAAAIATAAVLGAGDEWFQSFVPTRDSNVLDWVADVAGSAVGAWTVKSLEGRLPKWIAGA